MSPPLLSASSLVAATSTEPPTQSGKPYIGGQAVIEGVMMRSPGSIAIVCRRKNGELVVREEPAPGPPSGLRTWPVFRGMLTLVDTIRLGSRALRWSAEHFEADYPDGDMPSPGTPTATSSLLSSVRLQVLAASAGLVAVARSDGEPAAGGSGGSGGASGVLSVVLALTLFVLAPQAAAEGVTRLLGWENVATTSAAFQAITGAAKLVIVVAYFSFLRRIPLVYRLFQYHGAEHKTITTYEDGQELVVENARQKSTRHARCGTTFVVMVALVSILVFSAAGAFLPRIPGGRFAEHVGLFAMKLPLLPFVAGLTFELQRFFAKYCVTGPLRVLLFPGFVVQGITTAQPDDAQLEVALASLRATLWREARREAPAPPDRTFESYEALSLDPGYG